MVEFIILCAILATCWGYFTDWRDRQDMEKRIEQKVALRQKYVALAPDTPSAWEAFGDALRQGGYLPEALSAYERAEYLLEHGALPPVAPVSEKAPALLPAQDAPEALPAPAVTAPDAKAEADAVAEGGETPPPFASGMAPLLPVAAATDEPEEEAATPASSTALVSLGPQTVSGDDLFTSSEQILAVTRHEAGLAPDDDSPYVPALYTSPAPPSLPGEEPQPAVALPESPDKAVGYGLANKKRLVHLEMESDENPAKYGQTMKTRQQVCRRCGHLNEYNLRDCRFCGEPLPTDTMLDAWNHEVIRKEAVRQGSNIVLGMFIIAVCVWFVGWLPGLVKISVTVSALIVIPFRLLHAIGDR